GNASSRASSGRRTFGWWRGKRKNPAWRLGFGMTETTSGRPSSGAGVRSTRTRGHASRHAGGGQDVGVGKGVFHGRHRLTAAPCTGTQGGNQGVSVATPGDTDTRPCTRLPGSAGSRERYFTPLCT